MIQQRLVRSRVPKLPERLAKWIDFTHPGLRVSEKHHHGLVELPPRNRILNTANPDLELQAARDDLQRELRTVVPWADLYMEFTIDEDGSIIYDCRFIGRTSEWSGGDESEICWQYSGLLSATTARWRSNCSQ